MSEKKMDRREFIGGSTLGTAGLVMGTAAVSEAKQSSQQSGKQGVKIGMNLLLWTANPDERHLGLLDQLKIWGFDGAEFPMFVPQGSQWAAMGKHCESIGLGRTASVCVPEDANPVSPDQSIRKAAVDFLKRSIDCSHELGAEMICGPLYAPVGTLVGRGRTEEEMKYAADVLREAAEYAVQAKIHLSHEPLNRFETYVINSQEDGCKLADAVGMPNYGLHYDTFHAHIEEKDVSKAIQNAGKRIFHVHISENDRSTPGKGQVRWKATFEALKKIGYNRWLTIEAFGRALPEVAAATCIWRKMFESEEQLARDGLNFIRRSWSV